MYNIKRMKSGGRSRSSVISVSAALSYYITCVFIQDLSPAKSRSSSLSVSCSFKAAEQLHFIRLNEVNFTLQEKREDERWSNFQCEAKHKLEATVSGDCLD